MVAGPAPMIHSEDAMIPSIKRYATGLNADQVSKLLSLCPLADFEDDVRLYDSRRGVDDPPVSAHFYAAARILRDVLFSCSSFVFTYQAMKHARMDPTHKSFNNVRMYSVNQSAFNPLWSAVGMPWMGASHGSDIPYIFNGVFPEGELSKEDQSLSKRLSRSLISYAYSTDPVVHSHASARISGSFESWPVAYDYLENDEADLIPSHFRMLVLGGAYGTQDAFLKTQKLKVDEHLEEEKIASLDENPGFLDIVGVGKLQDVIANTLRIGSMGSVDWTQSTPLDRVMEHQKLFSRCAYINSLSETLGN